MKKLFPLLTTFIAFVFLFTNCVTTATTYREGYQDFPLRNDIFHVLSSGNTRTSQEKVFLIGIIRCAEIALENGYEYFYILDFKGNVSTSYYHWPGTSITNYRISKGIGDTFYGTSKTYNYGGYTIPRNSYTTEFVIKLVQGPEEGQEQPYDAEFILSTLLPRLEEIDRRDKDNATARTVAVVVLVGIAVGLSIWYLTWDPYPDTYSITEY